MIFFYFQFIVMIATNIPINTTPIDVNLSAV